MDGLDIAAVVLIKACLRGGQASSNGLLAAVSIAVDMATHRALV
jgi:hypothetical protein